MPSPYSKKQDKAFWKRAVSGRDAAGLSDLFDGVPDLTTTKIATAGSCFAQHIGRSLRSRNLPYMDYEPAPSFLTLDQADTLGYGVYSCRYGNIYTVRQLWQLFQEAFDQRQPAHTIWTKNGRYYDALRPGVQPNGFGSVAEVETLRAAHLKQVRKLFCDLDIFVFTLGLTEAWIDRRDGTVYPIAPGVIAGDYDPANYTFKNFRYPEITADLTRFVDALRDINPKARLILTVSPVPLSATATDDHVLVATNQSKATLRAVAGDMADDHANIQYFPSYEIITGQPAKHGFYAKNMRSVKPDGVKVVMKHFFGKTPVPPPVEPTDEIAQTDEYIGYEHCEESLLDPGEK